MTGMKKSLTAEIFESADDTCCYNPLEMLPTSLGITDTGRASRRLGMVSSASKIITTGGLNAPALPPARPRARVCVRYQQNNTEDKKTILFLTDQIRHTRTHAYICVVCRPTRRQSTSGQYNGSWTVRNERGMRE